MEIRMRRVSVTGPINDQDPSNYHGVNKFRSIRRNRPLFEGSGEDSSMAMANCSTSSKKSQRLSEKSKSLDRHSDAIR